MRKVVVAGVLALAAVVGVPGAATAAMEQAGCRPSTFSEQYQGKRIDILDRCQVDAGWVRHTVFINGRELGVSKLSSDREGYLSVINAYEEMPTLKVTARRAVETLGPGVELEPFRP